ncbi:exodeoxyribonuclease VII large subunit [Pseudoalteromonas sp. SCSIO 43201]|uniref:exodeoxyribonuclease VII large subunit n=1 Tax=Pseudoalteromonas sp. SCSIO 43201 TaxID=2822842 RepID=UPI002074BCDF|nr:exodeoxyribonuclease VII large subunit [Pseudoalteromonas sp. SCSIO 43201]USD27953.1 exodeoxyribonuclease VII large subunit [Pseudoalteromonas sp. SCSIO 43201]
MGYPNNNKTYSVSRLNREIRSLLEQGFASVQLTGEISNFVAPASGHWYFSLKDEKAQIKAAMWRGNNRYCNHRPSNGQQVVVQARVSVYEPRGDYQLIVEQLAPAGEGLLKQQFDALKMQLAAQGLFSASHKKPLPNIINRVGVITSATGAAIKDILTVLKRRAPQLQVVIYPALVQGEEAKQQICKQIAQANARREVDVLIVGRGGGSLEDLWSFNEESVAQAIFASSLPIISAVGHEIDTTISDYVADVRAPTPSAAAELVSPDSEALKQRALQLLQYLQQAFDRRLEQASQRLANFEAQLQLQHPKNQLMQQAQRIDELEQRLTRAQGHLLRQKQSQYHLLQHRFDRLHPEQKITHYKQVVDSLSDKLYSAMEQKLNLQRHRLAVSSAKLDSVSPLAVLARGYSIAKQADTVIKSVKDVDPDKPITTQLADGEVISLVKKIQ